MINLLKETVEVIHTHGRSEHDVIAVVVNNVYMPWSSFCRLADFNYDNNHGSLKYTCINNSLRIISESWFLERTNYMGKEWWELREAPTPISLRDLKVDHKEWHVRKHNNQWEHNGL